MTQAWRHRLRRLRFWLGGLLAAGLIAVAVMVGLVQLLLPLAAHYPRRVAAVLSERLGRPVDFASMQGRWQASGPLLDLRQVRIGGDDGGPALTLPSAQVKLDLGALLWPGRHLFNLRLSGLSLRLLRDSSGVWHLAGFGRQQQAQQGETFSLQALPGNLWLDGLHLSIEDAEHNRRYTLLASTVRLNNDGGRLRFAGLLRRQGVQGELHVIGRFRNDGSSGRVYLRAGGRDLGALFNGLDMAGYAIHDGQGSAAVWLDWKHGKVGRMQASVALRQLRVDSPRGQVTLPRWHAVASVRRRRGGDIELLYDQDQGRARVLISGTGDALRVRAAANGLDLGVPLALLGLLPQLPDGSARWLVGAQAHGRLLDAHLDYRHHGGLAHLDARFEDLGMRPVGGVPGIDHLRGALIGDAEAVDLSLPEQGTVVRVPHTFSQPFALSKLAGDVLAWHGADGLHLGLDALAFEGQGYGGSARGQVILPATGGRPFLDVYARVDHGQVPAAKLFWPRSMAAKTVQWLNQALVGGRIESGAALVRGSLADWPFHHHEGRFDSTAHLTDTTLAFSDQWPVATGIEAQANFIDNGMLITASHGVSLGNSATSAVAGIEDFGHSPLTLTVKGGGPGKAVAAYLRQSPIASRYADTLKNLSLGGSADFGFSLVLPLHHDDPQPMTLDGDATLKAMDVNNPDWRLTLGAVSGEASFDAHGFKAEALSTHFRGVPATLDIALGQATGLAQRPVDVGLSGRFDLATLLQGIDSLKPLVDRSQGSAPMRIGVQVETAADDSARTQLTVDTKLAGVALDLPAPLDKPKASSLPLHVSLGLPVEGAPLAVQIGDLATVRARLEDSARRRPMALAIGLGKAAATPLPGCGLSVGGHAGVLDVSGWAQTAIGWGDSGTSRCPVRVDVSADAPEIFGKRFQALRLQLAPKDDGVRLTVDGKQVKGTVDLPGSDLQRRGITSRLQRLYWPADAPATAKATPGASATGHAAAGGASTARDEASDDEAAGMHVEPSSLPPLHLWVNDLRLGNAHLGSARFESWPTAKGMHIDQLRTHARDVQITASGDWNGDAAANHTHLVIDFGAESLGHLLNALGFEGIFEGGRTQAHLDARWPGPPSAVSLARMEGSLGVDVSKGRIPEVQPGVGRLFGLLSITELPRRLSLDFGDVFGKGFGFDSITGHFRFTDGNAYTDDLHIKGPAADISITGRTGLRARDYDQQVRVVPHVGNSLPVVGALAGGPVGAAAGFAVQKLLGGGLNRAAGARYHIGGPWDKPKITLLEKKRLPRPARGSSTGSKKPSGSPAASTSVPASGRSGGS